MTARTKSLHAQRQSESMNVHIASPPVRAWGREDMKRVLEDHRILTGYVDFVGAQFHKAIDHEQAGHDKQVTVSRRRVDPLAHAKHDAPTETNARRAKLLQ